MKLSDAAVFGASRWKRVCSPIVDPESAKTKGCFLQVALLAAGCSIEEVIPDQQGNSTWADNTKRLWPWTEDVDLHNASRRQYYTVIWRMNDAGVPFEEILAYVRANEPAEAPTVSQAEQMDEAEWDARAGTREEVES